MVNSGIWWARYVVLVMEVCLFADMGSTWVERYPYCRGDAAEFLVELSRLMCGASTSARLSPSSKK